MPTANKYWSRQGEPTVKLCVSQSEGTLKRVSLPFKTNHKANSPPQIHSQWLGLQALRLGFCEPAGEPSGLYHTAAQCRPRPQRPSTYQSK